MKMVKYNKIPDLNQ